MLMLGTSVHVDWSNLPLRPIFLPLVAQLTFDLAGSRADSAASCWPGALVLQLDDEDRTGQRRGYSRPAAKTLRLQTQQKGRQKGQVFRYARHPRDRHLPAAAVALGPADQDRLLRSTSIPTRPTRRRSTARNWRRRLHPRRSCSPTIPTICPARSPLREGKSLWGLFLGAC